MKPNMGKIIIVEGYLASGKSTFARRLSKELNVPYLIKDTFKSAMFESVDAGHAEQSRFSVITFAAMMYVTERLLETGNPLIIEGNFVPQGVKPVDECGVIKALLEKYQAEALTFKFIADTRVLHKRFIERNRTPERGRANTASYEPTYDEINTWCKNLDAFSAGGEVITVDTSDFGAVDFSRLVEAARIFINCNKEFLLLESV
jgi:predicted kinase